jgi:hypothetical protein
MTRASIRLVALLCVASCTTVAGIGLWPARQLVSTVDQNGDGRPDVWRRYDVRGQLTEVDVDSNFDGSPDIQEYYQRGVLVRRESDRNFNGRADLVEEFDPLTQSQTRSVVDFDDDGTADLLVLFRGGRPVYSRQTCWFERSRVPPAPQSQARGGDGRLVALADPFASEITLRAKPISSASDEWIGPAMSDSLPAPCGSKLRQPDRSATRVASDRGPNALPLLLPRSPRAPPVR